MRSRHDSGEGLAARVRTSVERTVDAGTARMLHEQRSGAADGPPYEPMRTHDGVIDFRARRARYGYDIVARELVVANERFVDNAVVYSRGEDDEPFEPDDGLDDPKAYVAYGMSPFFLLDALLGAGGSETEVVREDHVRGVPATRVRLTLGTQDAFRSSPFGLLFPSPPLAAFPAEVWIDRDERIRRMGCSWPRPVSSEHRERFGPPAWTASEFWDFGQTEPLSGPVPRSASPPTSGSGS